MRIHIIVGEAQTIHLFHKQHQRLKDNTLTIEALIKISMLLNILLVVDLQVTKDIIKDFTKYIEPFLNKHKTKLVDMQEQQVVLEV